MCVHMDSVWDVGGLRVEGVARKRGTRCLTTEGGRH